MGLTVRLVNSSFRRGAMSTIKLLPAGPPLSVHLRRQRIVDWWMNLEPDGDTGRSTWEALDMLRDRVTFCLMREDLGLDEAESLTAQALLLIAGSTAC